MPGTRGAVARSGARQPRRSSQRRSLATGAAKTVSVMRLVPGERVRVALGQAFPADGRLLDGRTRVDEALLTGESKPVPKLPGDSLVAGSVNLGAPVTMQVQRVGADTLLEAIVAMMRDAMSQRPSLARVADRFAGPFLWVVLGLAALAAAAWSLIDPSRACLVAVSCSSSPALRAARWPYRPCWWRLLAGWRVVVCWCSGSMRSKAWPVWTGCSSTRPAR
jgi:Cu2+-exporting ATPase